MELLPLRLNADVENMVKATFEVPMDENGPEGSTDKRLSNLLKWLGLPPAYTTLRMNTSSHTTESIMEILRATLAEQCVTRDMEPFDMAAHPALRDCVVITNRGPKLDIKLCDKEVVVDLACGMAVLRGADVFVQGIMAAPTSVHAGDHVSVYADLNAECRKGLTQKFTGHKMFVGNGVAHVGREDIFCSSEKLSGVGIRMTQPVFQAPSLDRVLPALVFPQNLPSIVCGHVLDPQPGETILDMCAAPGGKTVHIATLMHNKGRVVALDKTPQKIARVENNAANWGITIIETYSGDSRRALDDQAATTGGPPYPSCSFDRILLDAPCSALGQRPASRNAMKLSELQSYSVYQRKLFSKAVGLLKPGGVLVFSTCTVTREENEGQVGWALQTFPSLTLLTQDPHIGGIGLPGTGLSEGDRCKVQRFDPSILTLDTQSPDTDTIGFFIAKFQKTS
ncbi:tRNA (cytosine(72)-C(5))-methyltransferase NSUN6-like [Haliotis cracherodii]|uniref:tRNA (cytosine(72)-C(5))-methyltransferase NSUN6-like n=1 Tax=Haliotis cracherodii TaxID=6455 RepID=UPI0039EA81AE